MKQGTRRKPDRFARGACQLQGDLLPAAALLFWVLRKLQRLPVEIEIACEPWLWSLSLSTGWHKPFQTPGTSLSSSALVTSTRRTFALRKRIRELYMANDTTQQVTQRCSQTATTSRTDNPDPDASKRTKATNGALSAVPPPQLHPNIYNAQTVLGRPKSTKIKGQSAQARPRLASRLPQPSPTEAPR